MRSTLLLFTFYILTICNVFVSMSSLPSFGDVKIFSQPVKYSLNSTVLLNDISGSKSGVGYRIKGTVTIQSIWAPDESQHLLKFELILPGLQIHSKSDSKDKFKDHKSVLNEIDQKPFFALWKRGSITKVYIDDKDGKDILAFKKGIISVFQFDVLDGERSETDVSGDCKTTYTSLSTSLLQKTKTDCINDAKLTLKTDPALSPIVRSDVTTLYELSNDLSSFASIQVDENHELYLPSKRDFGHSVKVIQEFVLQTDYPAIEQVKKAALQDVIEELERKYSLILRAQELRIKYDDAKEKSCDLLKVLKDNKEWLKTENLGRKKSAENFVEIVRCIRLSNTEQILKAFNLFKDEHVMAQLSDALGYAQTEASHLAAKAFLHFDSEYDQDNVERYLWALSIGNRPHMKVIMDIVRMCNGKFSEKISETLLMTVASVAHKYSHVAESDTSLEITNTVKNLLTNGLSKCKDIQCQSRYMRAFKNFKQPDTIPLLRDHITKSPKIIATLALQALHNIPKKHWNADLIKLCGKVFYQLERRYDTTARITALDIIIESGISESVVREFLDFLRSPEKEFEVKQSLLQRLVMISERCDIVKSCLKNYLKENSRINNYDVLAVKGMSTALERVAGSNRWSNVTLISLQEIKSGVVRRGTIDVDISNKDDPRYKLLSIGISASGLTSLMGSEEATEDEVDEETTSAAIELGVAGVSLKPFVLFDGATELMGHVWSGTASDRTPFFQALTLPLSWSTKIPLSTGARLNVEFNGAGSIDLAGQIHISLWNKVAHTLIESNAAIYAESKSSIDNDITSATCSSYLSTEASLNSETDVDFYQDIAVCVKVTQPDTVFTHNTTNTQSVSGSKYRIRRTLNRKYTVPGKTYALNRKNNEMCNTIGTTSQ